MNMEWFTIIRSLGIWLDGQVSWLKSKEWNVSLQQGKGTESPVLNAYHRFWHIQVTIVKDLASSWELSELTFIVKNGTKKSQQVRVIVKKEQYVTEGIPVSMVSRTKQSIVTYERDRVTLLSTSFFQDHRYQLAVGNEKSIWNEALGVLTLSPIWRGEHSRMAVINIDLEGYGERIGRIWYITGHCEEELYNRHMEKWMAQHDTTSKQQLS
ncbi:hypothetical protein [Halalkalibacter sp. APA_J-10(15)]|uniref:hypothetical protein n=1 Tax=unclassified Halalkalibacter TaxID=2893063 RepID=UPI001FF592B9|nr:hypothetical protein [Halalkalibacter sp. APA_J-10(15)]MCK0471519.1 hypothetical protein [Halalkalibacter sp. APA_J-10(15)]